MDRTEQLERENGVLKERLYACHALNLPQVAEVLQGHLDMMDMDVYEHRARLQAALSQHQAALSEATAQLQTQADTLQRLDALARELWAQARPGVPFPVV